jgi:ribosomal protein S18 acetylase RimI-like enzyme
VAGVAEVDLIVTTWYLEMLDPSWLRPAARRATAEGAEGLQVVQAEVPSPELSRFLYTAVGGDWWWTNRLGWTYDRWLTHLDRPALQTWVGYVSGTPAGYFELELKAREAEGAGGEVAESRGSDGGGADVEIVQFGLLPQFVGRGLGGALLAAAAERAWAMGGGTERVRRVWLHTCTLDGPHALANYRARGFRVCRSETRPRTFPQTTPGPWPGARGRSLPQTGERAAREGQRS